MIIMDLVRGWSHGVGTLRKGLAYLFTPMQYCNLLYIAQTSAQYAWLGKTEKLAKERDVYVTPLRKYITSVNSWCLSGTHNYLISVAASHPTKDNNVEGGSELATDGFWPSPCQLNNSWDSRPSVGFPVPFTLESWGAWNGKWASWIWCRSPTFVGEIIGSRTYANI